MQDLQADADDEVLDAGAVVDHVRCGEVGLEGAWTADPGVLGYRVGLIQMVSGPLLAQRISGTMQIMAGVQDIEDTLSGFYALHVWVTQGETSDLRATLIDNFVDDFTNPWPGIPKGRQLAASAAITAANIQDDDRIVVEIGFIARNQDANNVAGVIYYGTDYYSNGCPDMEEDP